MLDLKDTGEALIAILVSRGTMVTVGVITDASVTMAMFIVMQTNMQKRVSQGKFLQTSCSLAKD